MSSLSATSDICSLDEDRLGLTVTSGQVLLTKDANNLIGITIGGGAPQCPNLYISSVVDNSPVSRDATLSAGDEIVAINGISMKNLSREQAADVIKNCGLQVTVNYNQLHIDNSNLNCSLDIILKKFKHRLTEQLSPSTADALGLSRAILCNDSLALKVDELLRTETVYSELRRKITNTFIAFKDLNLIYKAFGDTLTEVGCREKQPEAGEAFRLFGELHRQFERNSRLVLRRAQLVIENLETYLEKAIPDTKLTLEKYKDVKFEYLSYCLKVKEMEDEEKECLTMHEYLPRVETGNYEFRLMLKCRQAARARFVELRADVLAKIELLDKKHVEHLSLQLQTLVGCLREYNEKCCVQLKQGCKFPLEMDLSKCFDFTYDDQQQLQEQQQQEQDLIVANNSDDDDDDDINNNNNEDCAQADDVDDEQLLEQSQNYNYNSLI